MYTSDQQEGKSPCGVFNEQKDSPVVNFELPQLPLRLKPSVSAATRAIRSCAEISGRVTSGYFLSETEYKIDILRESVCVSPVPFSRMESDNVCSEQIIQSQVPKNRKENIDSGSIQSDDAAIQSPSELPIRPKRRHHQPHDIRFSDIIGHASVKLRIDELILPLGLPSIIAESVLSGIRSIPASILLYGPPGCGKVGKIVLVAIHK